MSTSANLSKLSKNRAARTMVLHLSPDLESGDPGRETVDLAVLTQRSGWRAVIASSGGQLVTEAERAAVRHKRMPLDGRGPLSGWRARLLLEAVMQTERPALLHAHGIETLPFALAMSRSHGVPLVADLTQPLPALPRTKRLLETLKSSRAVLRVPSEFMGRHLHDTFDVEGDRLCLVPPGIALQWYSVGFISPERLQKLSHLWRLPEQASIILAPMPLTPEMGHKAFLEILREMRNENIYVVLVGSDRHAHGFRDEIEGLVGAYGLSGKVIMPEDCPDLPAACWLSSVVVAPNLAPRGQNLELLAAQAIGRPVIVTDIGANREMAQSGETAWVVPAGDIRAMATALREAIGLSSEQRLALAERTHDFVAGTFPQQAWFDGMLQLYESLMYPSRQTARANVA
jgi:glycosyltransferase involved in cell wall biosynthesis